MSTQKQEKLLDALAENSLVRAALILGADGLIKGKRGQARVFSSGNSPGAQEAPKPTENVYLVDLSEDLLAVVFDVDVEFESLRRTVDTLVRHAGLELGE